LTLPPADRSIDIHAHFVDPAAIDSMGALAPDVAPRVYQKSDCWFMDLPAGVVRSHPNGVTRELPTGLVDVGVRLQDMDAQGVEVQAISGYTWTNFYALPGDIAAELHRVHNDGMLRTVHEHPNRFLAIPGLPMQDPARSVAEIERLASDTSVVGVGIGTNIDGVDLDDPRFEPVWEALDQHNLPVLVHPPGLIAGADRMRRYHLINLIGNPVDTTIAIASVVFSGLLDRYRNLRFCFVHGGGFAPYQAGRWDHGWSVRPEAREHISTEPKGYLRRCFFDSLTHDPVALGFLGQQVGWDQVMLGTDYPWDMSTTTPLDDLDSAGADPRQRQLVTATNAGRFLRMPPAPQMSSTATTAGSAGTSREEI
jgi:aminocarboxymuconate-semialdehyde decarboxylase